MSDRSSRQRSLSVPRVFEAPHLGEIAFPLGGIGTGTVSLGGRGQLRDWEIFGRPAKGNLLASSFFSIWCQAAGREPVARVLESRLQPPFSGQHGMNQALVPGLPRLAEATFTGAYPVASIEFRDRALPVKVRLDALNPMIPLNAPDSSLPVAVLRYTVRNPGRRAVRVAIAGSLQNAVGAGGSLAGGYGGTPTGGNVNEIRQTGRVRGLLMSSRSCPDESPLAGTMALATVGGRVSHQRHWDHSGWFNALVGFWDDFATDGRLDDAFSHEPTPAGATCTGSVCHGLTVDPGAEKEVVFLVAWRFPNRTPGACNWPTCDEGRAAPIGNHYATRFKDAWDVVRRVAKELPRLERETRRYVDAVQSSTLPAAVLDAAMSNVSTLRTNTCFRTADGRYFGFEGCNDTAGCCPGNCTHVWNYEYVTPLLFPEVARSFRETEFDVGTRDDGLMSFRVSLPVGAPSNPRAAADGQMGCIAKLHREWRTGGDDALLRSLWPKAKAALEFAWRQGGWDADQDGVMEGVQHHTLDVELYGPHTMTGSWYLAALRAGEEMARSLGDEAFAEKCRRLFESGRDWMDEHLWNGSFYVQQLRRPSPDADKRFSAGMGHGFDGERTWYQVMNACWIDQLVGQVIAHVSGLGHLFDPAHERKALRSLVKHNFVPDMADYATVHRTYALNDEAALVMLTWPAGDRPDHAIPYYTEAMTGFEYHAAVHMIYEGLVDQGVAVFEAVRDRYDGRKRNPWDELECGHHYARAMASWAGIVALSGFDYDGRCRRMRFGPRVNAERFQTFWSTPTAWGTYSQRRTRQGWTAELAVLYGRLRLDALQPGFPTGRTDQVTVDGARARRAVALGPDSADGLAFVRTLSVPAGSTLTVRSR